MAMAVVLGFRRYQFVRRGTAAPSSQTNEEQMLTNKKPKLWNLLSYATDVQSGHATSNAARDQWEKSNYWKWENIMVSEY